MNEQVAPKTFAALTGELPPVKIVDIGANPIDGAPPYATLLAEGATSLVGFEPNPEALARLDQLKGPHETYLPYAIGDGARHTLHVCQAPGMASLLEPDPQVLGLFHGFPDWGKVMERIDIDTHRLDDIEETRDIDFIKIDIQGGELLALSNAPDRLATTLVIQTEVEFLPLYKGQPLFSDVERFLRRAGFMLHRFFPAVSRTVTPLVLNGDIYAGLDQLVWADAIFVRDFTKLEKLQDIQLLKTARILHNCYAAYDLVLHLLTHHDSRTGGTRATRYLAGLTA